MACRQGSQEEGHNNQHVNRLMQIGKFDLDLSRSHGRNGHFIGLRDTCSPKIARSVSAQNKTVAPLRIIRAIIEYAKTTPQSDRMRVRVRMRQTEMEESAKPRMGQTTGRMSAVVGCFSSCIALLHLQWNRRPWRHMVETRPCRTSPGLDQPCLT